MSNTNVKTYVFATFFLFFPVIVIRFMTDKSYWIVIFCL